MNVKLGKQVTFHARVAVVSMKMDVVDKIGHDEGHSTVIQLYLTCETGNWSLVRYLGRWAWVWDNG